MKTVLMIALVIGLGFFLFLQTVKIEKNHSINEKQLTRQHKLHYINKLATDFDEEIARTFKYLVSRKASARDRELIQLVRRMLDPIPTVGTIHVARGYAPFVTQQAAEVDAHFTRKRNGFFVECGAYDGETGSNSYFLEMQRGWSGLLIEVDPYFYTQLLGKNRKVWAINACLSPYDYVTELAFQDSIGQLGKLYPEKDSANKKKVVPCFPLETILLAINQTSVDYLSLDVEGLEIQILETIPFDRIKIKAMSVEWIHGSAGKQGYKDFMAKRRYSVLKEVSYNGNGQYAEDLIFVQDLNATK